MNTKIKIQNGSSDLLTDDEFNPKNVKIRISMMMPEDLLTHYRELSKKTGKPYQVLMQEGLRAATDLPKENNSILQVLKEIKLVREDLGKLQSKKR